MAVSRVDLALPLLLQSPPGQINNVYDDLKVIVEAEADAQADDQRQFETKSQPVWEQHNLDQLIVVDLPEGKGKSVLSRANVHADPAAGQRFLSPRHKESFEVDHRTLKTSNPKSYKHNEKVEPLRQELESLLTKYVADRYATGVVEVIAVPLPRKQIDVPDATMEEAKADANKQDPAHEAGSLSAGVEEVKLESGEANEGATEPVDDAVKDDPVDAAEAAAAVEEHTEAAQGDDGVKKEAPEATNAAVEEKAVTPVVQEDEETQGETKLVVHIVANRYRLSNFWAGRWRSSYTIDPAQTGTIEGQTDVRVHYFEDGNVQLHSSKTHKIDVEHDAKAIAKAIETAEEQYQQDIFKQTADLSEGAFRALRRQLPMTRQKVDWDKVMNYKLGSELSKQ